VQRRVGDDDAADGDRLEPRDRGELAGAADLDVDRAQRRLGALGGEFVREAPARKTADKAQTRLPVEPVDLVDHAVDVEGEIGARRLDLPVLRQRGFEIDGADEQVRHREAHRFDRPDHVDLGLARQRSGFAPAPGEEAQRARFRDGGVLLAQRSGGGVARIGELAGFLAALLGLGEQAGVESSEVLLRHVHLAAHLEDLGGAGDRLRDVGDRASVGRDVFADLAIAAGERLDQPAALVAQRAGEAVDLGLGGERHGFRVAQRKEAADAAEEVGDVLVVEAIVEAEHRPGMRDLGEPP
jgi:hypothetical protein